MCVLKSIGIRRNLGQAFGAHGKWKLCYILIISSGPREQLLMVELAKRPSLRDIIVLTSHSFVGGEMVYLSLGLNEVLI